MSPAGNRPERAFRAWCLRLDYCQVRPINLDSGVLFLGDGRSFSAKPAHLEALHRVLLLLHQLLQARLPAGPGAGFDSVWFGVARERSGADFRPRFPSGLDLFEGSDDKWQRRIPYIWTTTCTKTAVWLVLMPSLCECKYVVLRMHACMYDAARGRGAEPRDKRRAVNT